MIWTLLIHLWQIFVRIPVYLRCRKQHPIFKLPAELRYQICSCLALPSQAYLALSCKAFHEQFGSVLKNEEFRFPSVPGYGNSRSHYDTVSNVDMRSDLLFRLQTRRWLYCSSCLKLHPSREFEYYQRTERQPEVRHCRWPVIVVLCPCIRLTTRGKLRLLDQLKKKTTTTSPNTTTFIVQEDPVHWHQCSISDHPWLERAGIELLVASTTQCSGVDWTVLDCRFEFLVAVACDGDRQLP